MKNTILKSRAGYTLIEIMIAVGIFALIMMLAAGAYLMMIGISRQAQGITSGIDNLAFALETMTRTIRTSTEYSCSAVAGGGDCLSEGGDTFSVMAPSGERVSYTLGADNSGNGVIRQTINTNATDLTDSSIEVISLKFYSTGLASDTEQARVTIVISGQVTSGIYRTVPIPFTIETSATMRGSDI